MSNNSSVGLFSQHSTVQNDNESLRLIRLGQAISDIERELDEVEATESARTEAVRLHSGRTAFESFMLQLRDPLAAAGPNVRVTHNVSWVKIESMVNNHRVYISKGKLVVGRVDSTLPPEMVPGATTAKIKNGRIASWLPAEVPVVTRAIEVLSLGQLDVRPLTK